jgi:hypothetical protein
VTELGAELALLRPGMLALVKSMLILLLQDPDLLIALQRALREPPPEGRLTNQQVAAELHMTTAAWVKLVQRNESLQELGPGPARARWLLSEVKVWQARYGKDRRVRRAANDAARERMAAAGRPTLH